jgi:hypothetical protein
MNKAANVSSSTRLAILGVVILFVGSISTSSAQSLRLSGANYGEYWVFFEDDETDTNYKEHLEDKLKVSLSYGDIALRGAFFFSDPSLPNPKKLSYIDYSVQYSKDPVSILYGRFNKTFGRGLVLNQFIDEDFKIDKSLYGVQAGLRYFNSQLTLLSGKPRNVFFEENTYGIKNDDDTTAQIRGVDFETKIIPKFTIGGRYVRVNREIDLIPEAFTELFGGNVGFRTGPFDAYLEYAQQLGTYPGLGGRLKGYGVLFSSSLSLSGFGISFQMMDYDTIGFPYNKTYRYNEPVTPIKTGISVNRGVDEIGFGVSLLYSPFDFMTVELDNNKISTHDTTLNKLEQIFVTKETMDAVIEQAAKITTYPNYDLEITAAIEKIVKQGIEVPIVKKTETKPHLEVSYNFGSFFVGSEYGIEFVSSDTSDYRDQALAVSIGKPEAFVFTLRYERRSRAPQWLVDLEKIGPETSWPLAELSLDLTTRHNLRIRAGAEKGGLVCTGGVCRFEEPFKGIKLVLTSIF